MGLFQRIRQALAGGQSDADADLSALLEGYELPSFPAIVINVLAALRDPTVASATLAGHLEADPGLHVKVLRLVNSASFTLAKEVTNLHRAVTLLGRGRLETIVLTHAVADALPERPVPGFDAARFWLAAARRAFLARALAAKLRSRNEVEAFTIGLLQDMAVPVLAAQKGQPYIALLDRWRDDGSTGPGAIGLDALEREAFDVDHPTLGALMATKWGLPNDLCRAIAYHHDEERRAELEPAVVFAADLGETIDEAREAALVARAVAQLGLEEGDAKDIVRTALSQAESFASQLD